MKKLGIFSLRRLRWKLTLSYTVVTVAVTLLMEMILLLALVVFLHSGALATLVGSAMGSEVAPRLEPYLGDGSPNRGRLEAELRATGVEGEGMNNDPTSLDSLFVLGPERRVLAAVPERDALPVGERIDAGRIAGLGPLLRAAERQKEDTGPESANTAEGRVLAVVPIREDGRLVGTLVGSYEIPNLTGPLFAVIAFSAGALVIPAAFLGTIFGFFTAWGLTRRLRRLALAAQAWSRGDFSVTTKDRSKDELGQLSRELNNMAAQVDGLVQARGELATLEARNRFARDLHDSVKQQVFATSLQIAAARALIESDAGAAEAHLSQADDLVRQAQRELNGLIQEMRPAALEGKGLAAALRGYVEDWSRGSEIPASFHVRGEREIPLETEQALFRVAQEALANVAKHSGAEKAEVDLVYDRGSLMLRVADDGRGFDPAERDGKGFGLQSMRERLAKLGGQVKVESAPGGGTRVVCVCPLTDASKEKGRRIWASQ